MRAERSRSNIGNRSGSGYWEVEVEGQIDWVFDVRGRKVSVRAVEDGHGKVLLKRFEVAGGVAQTLWDLPVESRLEAQRVLEEKLEALLGSNWS